MSTSRCAGVSFAHPADWSVSYANPTTCVALEPRRYSGEFRTNIVLTVVTNGSMAFRTWQAGTDRLLPIMLHDYEVIDLERLDVAGHPGGRRLARHRAPCGRPVLLNQWFANIDGMGGGMDGDCGPNRLGITLTGTADALLFVLVNATFERAAASLTIAGGLTDLSTPA